MTSREQFEAWFKPRKERMKNDGICTLNIVRYRGMAWAGWQASRETVEIELPERRDYEETLSDHELGFNTGWSSAPRQSAPLASRLRGSDDIRTKTDCSQNAECLHENA